MKKIYISAIVSLIMLSCSSPVKKTDLKHLNGDWEIVQVETPDGETVDYGANLTVDYFKIDSVSLNTGIRKKFMPQFDGTRLTNGIEEQFTVIDSANSIYLKYKTDYATWIEKVISINESDFVVENDNEILYKYKRYEPIIID